MPHQKAQYIYPAGGNHVLVADIDFVLIEQGVGSRPGQDEATDYLILYDLVLVGISDPCLVAVDEVVKDAPRTEEVTRGEGTL